MQPQHKKSLLNGLVRTHMRIALCLEYPIDQHGGTEVLVSELIRGLSKKHEIILVSADTEETLARSPLRPMISEHIAFTPDWRKASHARDLAAKIARARPTLAHFHFGGNYNWGNRIFWRCPLFYLTRENIPCLSTNHGAFGLLEGYVWEKRPLAMKLALLPPAWLSKQIVAKKLRCEVAVSQHDWRALRSWYPPIRGKFRWIYHSRLHGGPPPVHFPREKIILCAGTIGPRKGQTVLAEAFALFGKKFPDWQLVFIGRIGDEALFEQMQGTIREAHLTYQVSFLGARSDDELRDWLRRAAIFVIPSTYEGLGLSLQEAQFYGCASVGTRCGGVEDLIQDGDNGLLVDINNPRQLAEALAKLMSDPVMQERFSRRGPESVMEKHMTAEFMVKAYEELYGEIVAQK
jgi:glycosyltransferase involved in cell wall biosynthesis